jgi:hypothetical protein
VVSRLVFNSDFLSIQIDAAINAGACPGPRR